MGDVVSTILAVFIPSIITQTFAILYKLGRIEGMVQEIVKRQNEHERRLDSLERRVEKLEMEVYRR